MEQVVYSLSSKGARVITVPRPVIGPGEVLVRNVASAVSVGTERAGVESSNTSLVEKARKRPDQVKAVVQQLASGELLQTVRRVRDRLHDYVAPGYSCAGIVEAVGEGCTSLEVGQRVACGGAGYAVHAEFVRVPRNLVAPIPPEVGFEAASFATIAAIAMQGVRQAEVRLGEVVVIIGLGLIGQLTVQLVRAAGAIPLGIDLSEERVRQTQALGADAVLRGTDIDGFVRMRTEGYGADAVIIAAATSSEDPIRLAGRLCRDRGRVVILGDVPINVPRSPYYEKELDVRLSRSYGPGRYDPDYEERGHDYPIGFVRWTEQRNMSAALELMDKGALDIERLVTHRYKLQDAPDAYADMAEPGDSQSALGIVFQYSESPPAEPKRISVAPRGSKIEGAIGLGFIGAGSFLRDTLLPAFRGQGIPVDLVGITSAGGVSARRLAESRNFRYATERMDEILADQEVDAVVIATPHSQHADQANGALAAGKAVFVEKPLALADAELRKVLEAARSASSPLLVGFNRRFAPATRLLEEWLRGVAGARVINIRVNAGTIPATHWIQDPKVGGGRLLGEVCHFIDLAAFLAGAPATSVHTTGLGAGDPDAPLQDNLAIALRFENGSLASIVYTAKGTPEAGKERVEVFAGGGAGVIDDFRRADVWGPEHRRWKGRQDKGHRAEVGAFLETLRSGASSPIPLGELETTTLATLRALDSLRTGEVEHVGWRGTQEEAPVDGSPDF